MTTPLARFVSISVKGEVAREATPIGIKRESKRAPAAWLGPSAGKNVAAHRAGDAAVLSLLTRVRAAHLSLLFKFRQLVVRFARREDGQQPAGPYDLPDDGVWHDDVRRAGAGRTDLRRIEDEVQTLRRDHPLLFIADDILDVQSQPLVRCPRLVLVLL